jgi:hypothetical protein
MSKPALRRQFDLLPQDKKFLDEYGLPWETIVDGDQWVLVHDFYTHDGYNHPIASIAVRLTAGYPQVQLDMVYVFPHLARKDGKTIPQTNATQQLDGNQWQRWSRHRSSTNPWRPGEDSIEAHIYLIEDWFRREFER